VLHADAELSATRAYPERVEHEPKWHDHIADWLTSRVLQPAVRTFANPARRLQRIVPYAAAHEAALRTISDARLRELGVDLRRRLRRDGFDLPVVGEVFALLREVGGRTVGQRHFDVQLMGG
jgi:preprotein translocase subunit SecA